MEYLFGSRRNRPESHGAMAVCSTPEETRLCLASNWRDTLKLAVFDIRDDEVSIHGEWSDQDRRKTRLVQFKDVTGDETVELLVLKKDALECREAQTNNLIWKLELPNEYHRTLTFDEASRTAWVHDSPELNRNDPNAGPPINLIDLANGKVIGEFKANRFADDKAHAMTNSGGETTLLWPSNSGMRVQQLDTPQTSSASVAQPTKTDPRRIGHYLICLLYTSPSPRDKRQSRMPSSA